MTITATPRKAGPYVGTGSVSQYSFAFKAVNPNHLLVVEANLSGVETALIPVTNYTVALNPNQDTTPGGTVTRTAGALPLNYRWTLLSLVPYEQPVDLPQGGAFSASVLEAGLDNLAVQVQQALEKVGRAVLVPATSDTDPQALVAELVAAGSGSAANVVLAETAADNAAASAAAAAAGNGGRFSSTVGGSANAITLTPTPALGGYVLGEAITFLVASTNTSAVTVNVSGLGAKAVTKAGVVALASGDLAAGQFVTLRYDGTRYQVVTPTAPSVAVVPPTTITHTWAIPGEIKVAVGEVDYIVPMFITIPAGRYAKLTNALSIIHAGTSVTWKFQKNGVDVSGYTGKVATTNAATADGGVVPFTLNDRLSLVVTAVSGTPKNFTCSPIIEYGSL